jgi:hypothetical protein
MFAAATNCRCPTVRRGHAQLMCLHLLSRVDHSRALGHPEHSRSVPAVGFGMLPYLHFVRDLVKACPNSPVIMVEASRYPMALCAL